MLTRGQSRLGPALALGLACLGGCDAGPGDRSKSATPSSAGFTAPVAPAPALAPSATASAQPAPEPSEAPALPASYPPRDECAGLRGFAPFRDKVLAAARSKDVEALVALADPEINLDFGGGAGPDEFRKRLSDPRSELWDEIAALAPLGCAVDGGVATMPWIFARLPEGFDDGATAMYGAGPRLALRARPAPAARLRAHLTWPVVELEGQGFDPASPFARVRLSDGTVGYMETARLRSLLDYRLVADRQNGEWKITALIAGD